MQNLHLWKKILKKLCFYKNKKKFLFIEWPFHIKRLIYLFVSFLIYLASCVEYIYDFLNFHDYKCIYKELLPQYKLINVTVVRSTKLWHRLVHVISRYSRW